MPEEYQHDGPSIDFGHGGGNYSPPPQREPEPPLGERRGSKATWIILGLAISLALGLGGAFWYLNWEAARNMEVKSGGVLVQETTPSPPISGEQGGDTAPASEPGGGTSGQETVTQPPSPQDAQAENTGAQEASGQTEAGNETAQADAAATGDAAAENQSETMPAQDEAPTKVVDAASGAVEQPGQTVEAKPEIQPDEDQTDAAIEKIKQAKAEKEIRPSDNDRRLLQQGFAAYNKGDFETAARHFSAYVAKHPGDAQARGYLQKAEAAAHRNQSGMLEITCLPPARVYLDGRSMGNTPLFIKKVKAGKRKVEVKALGASKLKEIYVKPGAAYQLDFRLSGGALVVKADPRAVVYLDGKPVGRTPLSLSGLLLGKRTVTVKASGYHNQSRQVELLHQHPVTLSFFLESMDQ